MKSSNKIMSNVANKCFPFKTVLETFQSSKVFKPFRKRYRPIKFSKIDHLYFDNHNELDICLCVIHSSDNSRTHAIAMTGDYIFDSNGSKALPRTIEGIDCCCGDSFFLKFDYGYIWKANELASIIPNSK